MNDVETSIESHREQLLKARLAQLEEVTSKRKEQLQELYILLKSRDPRGVLNGLFEPEAEDSDAHAFVDLYEKGTINEFKDWPSEYVSPVASPKTEPEMPTTHSQPKAVEEEPEQTTEDQEKVETMERVAVEGDDEEKPEEMLVDQMVSGTLDEVPPAAPSPGSKRVGEEEVEVSVHSTEPKELAHAAEDVMEIDETPHGADAVEVEGGQEEHISGRHVEKELSPAEDDVSMDNSSKDDIDIISEPTSPAPQAVSLPPARRALSRGVQRRRQSPIQQVASPSRSPSPPPVRRPRTRSTSSALVTRISPSPSPSPPPRSSPSPLPEGPVSPSHIISEAASPAIPPAIKEPDEGTKLGSPAVSENKVENEKNELDEIVPETPAGIVPELPAGEEVTKEEPADISTKHSPILETDQEPTIEGGIAERSKQATPEVVAKDVAEESQVPTVAIGSTEKPQEAVADVSDKELLPIIQEKEAEPAQLEAVAALTIEPEPPVAVIHSDVTVPEHVEEPAAPEAVRSPKESVPTDSLSPPREQPPAAEESPRPSSAQPAEGSVLREPASPEAILQKPETEVQTEAEPSSEDIVMEDVREESPMRSSPSRSRSTSVALQPRLRPVSEVQARQQLEEEHETLRQEGEEAMVGLDQPLLAEDVDMDQHEARSAVDEVHADHAEKHVLDGAEPIIKVEEDHGAIEVDDEPSRVSRAPSASFAVSAAEAESRMGSMFADGDMYMPEESPTRSPSPSRAPSVVAQPADHVETHPKTPLTQVLVEALAREVEEQPPEPSPPARRAFAPDSLTSQLVQPEPIKASPSTPPPIKKPVVYAPRIPGPPYIPPPAAPAVTLRLDKLPEPISAHAQFVDVFEVRPIESRPEPQEDQMNEGSLFSPKGSPGIITMPLPDTSIPTPPVSPLINAYSSSLQVPPIDSLPSTFLRKVHPAKLTRRREREEREKKNKRDKEAEGTYADGQTKEREKEKEKRESKDSSKTWIPWETARWGAHFRANPAHKMVRRSGKALTTKQWNIALHEIKIMRALERIEKLKAEGRWSFRQPKKQKSPIVAKSHWDWLMDEMKWMRTDFREERRWKTALAFNIAHAVREWHLADPEERKLLCVGVNPRVSLLGDEARPMEEDSHLDSGVGDLLPKTSKVQTVDLPALNDEEPLPDGPWQHTEEIDPEREAELVRNKLREDRKSEVPENANDKDEDADADGEEDDADGEMDVDEGEGTQEPEAAQDATQVDGTPGPVPTADGAAEKADKSAEAQPTASTGIKTGSTDVTLTSEPAKLPGTSAHPPVDESKSQIRASILALPEDSTFVDLEELCSNMSQLSTVEPFTPVELPELFPDLTAYQPLYAAPEQTEAIVVPKGDKKTEKKEKKALEELSRADELSSLKLLPVSTFMQYKPLLVSALEPAKHWRDDEWVDLDELAVTGDDAPSALEAPPDTLFGYQKPRLTLLSHPLAMPKDPQRRFNETSWNADEDQLLKQIVERYPGNWNLIADVFNSSRVTISTDKRSAWDCLARWDAKWNEGRILAPSSGPPTAGPDGTMDMTGSGSVPPTPVSSQTMWMMTRKRSAGQLNLSLNGQQAESRKRRRHNHMHEAMRKSAKKRETTQKQNVNIKRVNNPAHETHSAYTKVSRTPAELSRMKAELDRRMTEERARQQEELRKRSAMAALGGGPRLHGALPPGQQPVGVPMGRPGQPQGVPISQQAARMPNLAGGNMGVPNISQPQLPLNITMQQFQALSPEQKRVILAQMQAQRQAAGLPAHQQNVQQLQLLQQQQAQQGAQQPGVQQPQATQQQQPGQLPQTPQLQPQQHPQLMQAHLQAAQGMQQPVTSPHPQLPPQASPPLPQASPVGAPQGQGSPPRQGTPMIHMAGASIARAGMPQHPQVPRSGSVPHAAGVQQSRPASSQPIPQQQQGQARPPATPQQAAMMQQHQTLVQQNGHNFTPEQIKRVYSQMFWQHQGNAAAQNQAMHASSSAQMGYPAMNQQQVQQAQQQQPTPPRPAGNQPNAGSAPGAGS